MVGVSELIYMKADNLIEFGLQAMSLSEQLRSAVNMIHALRRDVAIAEKNSYAATDRLKRIETELQLQRIAVDVRNNDWMEVVSTS